MLKITSHNYSPWNKCMPTVFFFFLVSCICAALFTFVNFPLILLSSAAPFLHRNTDVVRSRNSVSREMADGRECRVLEFHFNRGVQVKVRAYLGWVVSDFFGWENLPPVERLTTEPAHIPCKLQYISLQDTTVRVTGQVRLCLGMNALYNCTSNKPKWCPAGNTYMIPFRHCTKGVGRVTIANCASFSSHNP